MFHGNGRNNNQFQRVYGFFRCPKCNKRWESSHVYRDRRTEEIQYGQECKDCHVMCTPYRVERLKCSQCGQTDCDCDRRHVDPSKSHRSDLCAKCRAGYSCVH